MNKHSQYTADRLETARRTKDTVRRLSSLLLLIGVMAMAVLAVATVDYQFLLSGNTRIVGFTVFAGCVVVGGLRLFRLIRHRSTIKEVALDLESYRSELGCMISTSAEYLAGERKASQSYEPEIVDALHEQAAKSLLLIETPYRWKLLKPALLFTAAAMSCACVLVFVPAGSTAIQRVIAPWSDAHYTNVELKPGNVEVPVGKDIEIAASFMGRKPGSPHLDWSVEGSRDWQSVALTNLQNGAFHFGFSKIEKAIRYKASGGDAESSQYEIRPYVPPEVKDTSVTMEFPAYTKMPPSEEPSGNVTVVRGSKLTFHIETAGDVTNARLRFATATNITLQKADAPDLWTRTLTPAKDTFYWIELIDSAGRKGGTEQPFQVVILPDEKPQVEIVDPGKDIRAERNDKIPVKISVSDDFGIDDVQLVYRKMNGSNQTVRCKIERGSRDVLTTTQIDLSTLELKDYEVVAYHAEARDNNTLDGPGIGISPTYFIEITTKEKALSQCNGGNSQEINILALQKQVIAATMRIEPDTERERVLDMASAQRETKKYAEIFKESFILAMSPEEAKQEFASAIREMDAAADALENIEKDRALRAEEKALAHLYQVARLLPEFEKMCQGKGGNCVKIVLRAIEKHKEQQKKDSQNRIQEVLNELKQLEQAQKRLEAQFRPEEKQPSASKANSGTKPSATGEGGARPGEGRDGQPRDIQHADGQKPSHQVGQQLSQGKRPGDARDDQGTKDNNAASAGNGASSELNRLSDEQMKLAREAAALADKLAQLARRDVRVSNHYSSQVRRAAENLGGAGSRLRKSDRGAAMLSSARALHDVGDVVSALEKLLRLDSRGTDLATEEYPKEFETIIADYFRKLSHEE